MPTFFIFAEQPWHEEAGLFCLRDSASVAPPQLFVWRLNLIPVDYFQSESDQNIHILSTGLAVKVCMQRSYFAEKKDNLT